MKKRDYTKQSWPPKCGGCKEEIDPDVCWCGDLMINHHSGCEHIPTPMGCRCGYVSLSDNFNVDFDS